MVARPHRPHLILPVAPLGAAAIAASVALLFAVMPASILESLVLDSGIAALVPAAEPPLGITARAALIMIGGGGLGLLVWLGLYLLVGTRTVDLNRVVVSRGADATPILRRADAHPDAPARRPLFASRDLGTPFLDVRAPTGAEIGTDLPSSFAADMLAESPPIERALPRDLDLPLAAFDPQAMTAAAWRPQVFEAGERFETFDLPVVPTAGAIPALEPEPEPMPTVTPQRAPRVDFDASASIHALLDRLEKGVVRRETANDPAPSMPPQSLQESLASLRSLAMRVN
ncbi:hypothetical protein [Sphingomonas endolithica]|uniref:hypothetical protein n=1 Tax=Sphingomonas endolithica TaxID=2972485 RepID=UPI0021AF23A2|nr:hypothetical protein [Sphingomonas sp. ZFBP2030]